MPKKSCECYVKNKLKKPTLTCNGTLVRQFDYNKFKDKIQTPPLSETKTEINNYEIDDIVCAIDSGASLLKFLIFEPPTCGSNETEKCVTFWKYMRERQDVVPKKGTRKQCKKRESLEQSKSIEEGSSIYSWSEVLKDIRERNLHKLAMATTIKKCDFCKESFGESKKFVDDKDEIIALNSWRPVPVIDVAVQTSVVQFVDRATDDQSTPSFKKLYEANKPPEYVDKGTDVPNYDSLMNTQVQVQTVIQDRICTCTKSPEECPYHKVDCTCGTDKEIECPYHKLNCTCATSSSCPYHKAECKCAIDTVVTAEECPYHKIKCTCAEDASEECPYHKVNCTCAATSVKEIDKATPKDDKEKVSATEKECPYHKINCTCAATSVTEINKATLKDDKEKVRDTEKECPYHKINCTCATTSAEDCPYHKLKCSCSTDVEYLYKNLQDDSFNENITEVKVCSVPGEDALPCESIPTCPYEIDKCTCGIFLPVTEITCKTLDTCKCSDTSIEVPPQSQEGLQKCPYEKENCNCAEEQSVVIDKYISTCPYKGDECVCATVPVCPYNIFNCQCGAEIEIKEPCLEIVQYCTCGKKLITCDCSSKDIPVETRCPYNKYDCNCAIESSPCPYNIENCDCADKDVCKCDYPQPKCANEPEDCTCSNEKLPCPYGKEDCECGKPEPEVTNLDVLCKNSSCTCNIPAAPPSSLNDIPVYTICVCNETVQ